MSNRKPDFIIDRPLLIMFKQDDKTICHIHPENMTYEMYGMAICDAVRHISKAFKVKENDVWKWVDMERHNPTTTIEQAN